MKKASSIHLIRMHLSSSHPFDRPTFSTDGRLRFIYEDANGKTSTREVSDFLDDGVYIEGLCHSRQALRIFRRNRVVEPLEGEGLLGPEIAPEDFVEETFANRFGMGILFTGFS